MNSQMTSDRTLRTLKALLKRKGFSYIDVAERLGMTESGVKKMLNAQDISLNRLSRLCQMMGMTLSQFTAFTEQSQIPIVQLSTAQEEFLLSKSIYLRVYWRFAVENRDLHTICVLERITLKELGLILEKILQKKLIQKNKNQFARIQEGKFRFDEKSRLTQYLNKTWSELTLQRSLKKQKNSLHRLLTLTLSEKSFTEFKQRLENLVLEIANQSTHDELHLKASEINPASILFCMTSKGVLDSDIN